MWFVFALIIGFVAGAAARDDELRGKFLEWLRKIARG